MTNLPDESVAPAGGDGAASPPEGPEVAELHAAVVREMDEPRDGHEPTPLWLTFVMMALLGWGGWYLGTYSGGFDPAVYDERSGAGAAATVAPQPVDPMVLGRRVFANCQACHQADGAGVAGSYPPLVGSPWVGGDPAVLAAMVLHGLQGEWEAQGATYNQVMPAWSHLGDEQLAALLTYVRGSFGHQAGPVVPEVVAGARAATEGQREPFTLAQVRELSARLAAEGRARGEVDG